MKWPFEDPANVAVFTTKQIIEKQKPILFVTHDEEDGAWQSHEGDLTSNEDARIASLLQIVTLDPSIMDLADLPFGWEVSRNSKES
ncbi:hypothetical protein ACFQZT_20030 [Paenibacillus sp. GCM10027628]|uniref:hypothetical protein n=1 Tax=Paenibacillus sp. GCM10027628 TaxID=3273413 RepID=UPI0036455A36